MDAKTRELAMRVADWKRDPIERIRIVQRLGERKDPSVIPVLAMMLPDVEMEMVPFIRGALIRLGALDALRVGLGSDDVADRRHAVRLIGLLQDERGLSDLMRALEDRDPGVREEAVDALATFASTSARRPLVHRMLHDPEVTVRGAAAQAVGGYRDPAAKRALEAARKEESSPWVRMLIDLAIDRCRRRGPLPVERLPTPTPIAVRCVV